MLNEKESKKIAELSSKTLCAHIVAYRALGLNKEISIECMKELKKREDDGDGFDYYKFIEDEMVKIPKSASIDHDGLFGILNIITQNLNKK